MQAAPAPVPAPANCSENSAMQKPVFEVQPHYQRPTRQDGHRISRKAVYIELLDDDASKRLVLSAAKRVIQQHRDELQSLAYK